MYRCRLTKSLRIVALALLAALIMSMAPPVEAAAEQRHRFEELMSLCSADPQQAKAAGTRWLGEATRDGNDQEQIQALLVLADAAGRLEDPAQIASHAERGVELARRLGDAGAHAKFLSSLAYARGQLGGNESGWSLHQRALQLAESQEDEMVQAHVFGNYGAAALWNGTIQEAQGYLNRSLAIFQQQGPPDRLAIALLKLNDLHNALDNPAQALRDVQEASRVLPPGRYPYLESIVAYNLGANHLRADQLDLAQEQFERALALSTRLDDVQGIAFTHQRLAMIAVKQGAPGVAEQHALEALKRFDTDNQIMQLLTQLTLADARTHLGNRDALRAIEQAAALVVGQDEDMQVRFHVQAGRTRARFGQYAKAYDDMLAAYTTSTGLARKQNSDRVHEQQARFDSERKEMQNELLRQEKSLQQARLTHKAIESQRRGLLVVLLVLVTGGVVAALLAQVRHRSRLTTLALKDELTGAPNRRNILLYARQQVAQASPDRPVCLAMADLDFFKKINDTYGHGIGDRVLQAFVSTCTGQLRGADRLGRIGGEEFLFVLPAASRTSLPVVFRRLQVAFRDAAIDGLPEGYPLTFSCGAVFTDGTATPDQDLDRLLERADSALYRAKEEGRECLRIEGDSAPFAASA